MHTPPNLAWRAFWREARRLARLSRERRAAASHQVSGQAKT